MRPLLVLILTVPALAQQPAAPPKPQDSAAQADTTAVNNLVPTPIAVGDLGDSK